MRSARNSSLRLQISSSGETHKARTWSYFILPQGEREFSSRLIDRRSFCEIEFASADKIIPVLAPLIAKIPARGDKGNVA